MPLTQETRVLDASDGVASTAHQSLPNFPCSAAVSAACELKCWPLPLGARAATARCRKLSSLHHATPSSTRNPRKAKQMGVCLPSARVRHTQGSNRMGQTDT